MKRRETVTEKKEGKLGKGEKYLFRRSVLNEDSGLMISLLTVSWHVHHLRGVDHRNGLKERKCFTMVYSKYHLDIIALVLILR